MLGRTSLGDPNGLGQDRLDGGRRAWLERRRQGSLFRLRRRFSAEAGRAGRGAIRQVRLLRKQEEGRSSRSAAGSRVCRSVDLLPRTYGRRRAVGSRIRDRSDRHRGGLLRPGFRWPPGSHRSEEHTSELQSLMRISYAVFCLKKKKDYNEYNTTTPEVNRQHG